jgi:hypothetical protein
VEETGGSRERSVVDGNVSNASCAQGYRIQQRRQRQSRDDRTPRRLRLALDLGLVIQHRVQKRAVDFDFSVVADEAELAEFVHEEADAGAGGPDHLGQGFLTDVRADRLRGAFLAEIGQQKQQARQPLLT